MVTAKLIVWYWKCVYFWYFGDDLHDIFFQFELQFLTHKLFFNGFAFLRSYAKMAAEYTYNILKNIKKPQWPEFGKISKF